MEKKLIQAGLMGMNQDVISQKIGQAQAYEIKNFRLNATQDSNAFELTTEKGTKQIQLSYVEQHVEGTIIGYCVLNDYLVLFTHEHIRSIERKIDRIYRLTLNDNEVTGFVQLYEGNLDFQKDVNPTTDGLIDAIPYYETELIQKVYWIDGINQPRVINIVDVNDIHINDVDYDPYGFVQEITGDYSSIQVTKNYVGGMFHAGVIQYAYSFFNENAQETPVIDVTPLNYIAHEDRGEKPDTRVGCTFTLRLNVSVSLHDKFDYIRFYSIYRSSLDTTPLVKVINEVKTDSLTAIHQNSGNPVLPISHYILEFTDDNTQGYVYDAQQLLIRNNKIVPQTFNYKDGKLFFGNFRNEQNISQMAKDTFVGLDVDWISDSTRTLEIQNEDVDDGFIYNHVNQLNCNSQEIRTFKSGEYYILGVQLQDKYGEWSEPYYVDIMENTEYPKGQAISWSDQQDNTQHSYSYNEYCIPYAQSDDTISQIMHDFDIPNDYIRIRPVVSFLNSSERNILCQGIVNPTVFNLGQRVNGSCYAQASWFFRPVFPNHNVDEFGHLAFMNQQAYLMSGHNQPLGNSNWLNGEIQGMYSNWPFPSSYNPQYDEQTESVVFVPYEYLNFQIPIALNHPKTVDGIDYYYAYEDPNYAEAGLIDGVPYHYKLILGDIREKDSSDPYGISYDIPDCGTVYAFTECGIRISYVADSDNTYTYEGPTIVRRYYVIEADGQISLKLPTSELNEYVEFRSIPRDSDIIDNEVLGRARDLAHDIVEQDIQKYQGYYYVDTQVCTVNSPDIENDSQNRIVDTGHYKPVLKGLARFTSSTGRYNIIANTPLFLNDSQTKQDYDNTELIRGTKLANGFYNQKVETKYQKSMQWANSGGTVLSALNCWFDDVCNIMTWQNKVFRDNWVHWNPLSLMYSYAVYPWQRKYLNNYNWNQYLVENSADNDSDAGITTENETSLIVKKILANLRFGYTDYSESSNELDIDAMKMYDSEENQIIKLEEGKYYSGNVDQLVTYNSEYLGNYLDYVQDKDSIWWKSDKLVQGYPIIVGGNSSFGNMSIHVNSNHWFPKGSEEANSKHNTPSNRSTDSIWIRYKSSPHFVFKINGGVMPIPQPSGGVNYDFCGFDGIEQQQVPWDSDGISLDSSDNVLSNPNTMQSCLYVADIQKDTFEAPTFNITADSVDFNLMNRIWLPCGPSLPLDSNSNSKLQWLEGDTFFQRYDCLKTYPFSNDDYQSVVEIGSFMLETRINLDGRYDTNRGLMDNTAITRENFNLINPIYSQMNNFFQYRMLDDRFNNRETEYGNRITWTLDKQNGDDVDQWTRVTELGIIDMDGDKGDVTKIERYDNNLYVFQEKGVARLNYNDNLQIPTEGNVPIEVINSGFVNGKRYISENVGLQEKWCSISTPSGIFFKDGYSKALYQMKYDERRNPIVAPLSQSSMQKWTETHINDIYRVNYDNGVNEVLFMTDDNDYPSLAYSNLYQAFSSFYDYMGFIGNYKDLSFSIRQNDNKFWLLRKSDSFNKYYGTIEPYWIKWTSVIDGYDCIFDNIHLKGNTYANTGNTANSMNDNDIEISSKGDDIYQGRIPKIPVPFDKISVSNDRQAYEQEFTSSSQVSLVWKDFKPIKKFGVWRARIPRFNSTGKQYLNSRIRNHWTRIGLKNSNPDTNKTIIRDIKVDAFF